MAGIAFAIVSIGSGAQTPLANSIDCGDKVPNRWEDFLKPELKGKKFLVDVRPYRVAALVPALGEEWVKNYARKCVGEIFLILTIEMG